jgi:hypothetical protein
MDMRETRPHQDEALSAVAAAWDRGEARATAVMACGSGKTLVGQRAAEAAGAETVDFAAGEPGASAKKAKQASMADTRLREFARRLESASGLIADAVPEAAGIGSRPITDLIARHDGPFKADIPALTQAAKDYVRALRAAVEAALPGARDAEARRRALPEDGPAAGPAPR